MLKEVSDRLTIDTHQFSVLDDVIDTLRFRGSIFFHSSLAAPWGMSLPPQPTPRFHIALEGGFCIGTDETKVSVAPMDIVMLPKGDMHWIADQAGSTLVPSEQAGKACELGTPLFQQGEITNLLMCGLVDYEAAISHPILSALPTIFHLSNIQASDSIWLTVTQIDNEVRRSNSRKNTVIDRMTEVLFIQLLNQYVSDNEHLTGFLAALRDPRLEKVLQLLHMNPQHAWTQDLISASAGMSRATLQRKFKAGLGVSPMTYLNRWRISKAYQLVKHSNLSLDSIAESIGFSDARTMRTAFRRQFGITPSALRKEAGSTGG
jgi:AraC-like DNA-binding protein